MNPEETTRRKSRWEWLLGGFGVLLLAAYFVLAHFMGGPRDVYGFLRYALPQWHEGDVRVGDRAPDARIFSLDGRTAFHLRERIGKRPLVLIFGSYT
ncbi:MAG TPA: hypothetical protein VJN90_06805 [Candidatus Acidoferrales bacterium]|nr:hypothetical protein [Candidatus Acidoferrales bacterium]